MLCLEGAPGLDPTRPGIPGGTPLEKGRGDAMLTAALAMVVAGACAGPGTETWYKLAGYSEPNSGMRMIANAEGFPTSQADSVRRSGFNGLVWRGEVYRNQPHGVNASGLEQARVGAVHAGDATVYVRVGQLVVGINAWEVQGDKRLEAGRQEWLKEHGYTGGVRTFVNDSTRLARLAQADATGAEPPATNGPIQPRAIIELAPDTPRFRSRMHVDATLVREALERSARGANPVTRVIVPDRLASAK